MRGATNLKPETCYLKPHTLTPAGDPLALEQHEWLLTNGTGGFAMGTAMGCPTRRYHGLFVPATREPVGRVTCLNQMWEQLELRRPGSSATQTLDFASLGFRGGAGERVYAPRGHEMLQRFHKGLGACWDYAWGDVRFSRALFLHWQQQAVTLRYRVTGLDKAGSSATLKLRPMLTLRDYHALLHHDQASPFTTAAHPGAGLTVWRDELAVTMALTAAEGEHPQLTPRFVTEPDWWRDIHYPIETGRGQDDQEDYWLPGSFEVDLPASGAIELHFTVTLGEKPVAAAADVAKREAHLKPMVQAIQAAAGDGVDDTLAHVLAAAADDFVVGRTIAGEPLSTILAGYPWFADWGRDTFIALPGLLLTTGRYAQAKAVLRAFARAIKAGLVPNRFDDYHDQAAHYNTVDASLWFVHAAMQYHQLTGDDQAWEGWLAQACVDIVDAYQAGTGATEHEQAVSVDARETSPSEAALIRMDSDGLIAAGSAGTQLTWMDAACAGVVFTPRQGKAVEINALWYNALMGLAAQLPKTLTGKADSYAKLAQQVKQSFASTFWRDEQGYLFDHVWTDEAGEVHRDASVRPNQIFAVSLPYSPLSQTQQAAVINVVRDRLLTPVGLRTLPTNDPAYHGKYQGPQFVRDEAYHQGTIWPWLIGPFAEAVLRQGDFSPQARQQASHAIAPLLTIIRAGTGEDQAAPEPGALGQLHEIYEADPDDAGRHRPVGCMAQAWSVAEVLRITALLAASPGAHK